MPSKSSNSKTRTSTRNAAARQDSAPPHKYVYFFGGGSSEGDRSMRDLLGGKGANLAEMTNAGLPVPPGFTVSTEACTAYYAQRRRVPAAIDREMEAHLGRLEKLAGAKLGAASQPLLVSVRSGARFSMPGMMDTILNLGLNDRAVEGLKARTANGRFAFDSYRRFIQMFGNVVLEIPREAFEEEFDGVKAHRGVKLDTGLDEVALREVVERFKAVVIRESGEPFPLDARRQLRMARDAVFRSWQNPRAKEYRRIYDIPDAIGTAVNVQAMVFGNTGDRSGTGVGFTRNPATGANEFYGEFLINAQGEDVVAGIRTPQPIAELEQVMPRAYAELRDITKRLERHYRDVQDFEFTIEDEKLYMLQTRNGKRTGHAAVVIATDLVEEGVIEPVDAVRMVDPDALTQLLAPVFDPEAWAALPAVTRGLPASPGAACGEVVFTADEAVRWARQGRDVLLVRKETVPDDIHGMHVAQGVLTATGGMTSHAAVVGRQMGKPSVVGAGELHVSESERVVTVNGQRFEQGDYVSFDGLSGEVKIGRVATRPSEIPAGAGRAARPAPLGHLRAVLQAAEVGRQGAPARHPRQRRPAGPGRHRLRLRRARHRPVPHGAHVLRRRSNPHRAAHDPGRDRGRPPGGARRAVAAAARRLLRRVQGDAGPAGHHPADRPAAARVPPEARGADGRDRARRGARPHGRARGEARAAAARRAAPRVQSDDGPPRRAAGDQLSRDCRDAGARHPGGGLPAGAGGGEGRARDHDPAGRARRRVPRPEGGDRPRRGRDARHGRAQGEVPGRDDDRDPAQRAGGRRESRPTPISSRSAPTT